MNWFKHDKNDKEDQGKEKINGINKNIYKDPNVEQLTKEITELMGKLKEDMSPNNNKLLNIFANDVRLMRLAEYSASKGYTQILTVTKEDLYDEFSKLKNTVLKGSMTLQELEDRVYNQYGITELPKGEKAPRDLIDLSDIEFADIPEDSPENH